MLAGDSPGIIVGIFDVLFFDPKQCLALGTLLDEHGHTNPLRCW
jgi:hypothetical protein